MHCLLSYSLPALIQVFITSESNTLFRAILSVYNRETVFVFGFVGHDQDNIDNPAYTAQA